MGTNKPRQSAVRVGTHGERYGNWMSATVLCAVGGLAAIALALAVACFAAFHVAILGALFTVVTVALAALLCWMAWIRWQYSYAGGRMMDRAHETMLAYLDFDGEGRMLDVGCGSGALTVRAALTWPDAQIVGVDCWTIAYNYTQAMCEQNAKTEGVSANCTFQHGDATKLDFPDESFDAVVSNYVYHNITGADKRALLKETLRVLKKGGVFALNDDMKPHMYGNMDAFAQELLDAGYQEARIVDTASEVFGSPRRAALMMLGDSRLLVGRK